jgi:hypothetical protein
MSDLSDVDSLANPTMPTVADDGGLPTTTPSLLSVCESLYSRDEHPKKLLYLFCIGLQENGTEEPLVKIDSEPWSRLPRASLKPKNIEYVSEVNRRAKLYAIVPTPRPSNWKRNQIMEWLDAHPVSGTADVAFLRREVSRVTDLWHANVAEEGKQADEVTLFNKTWRGAVPYLRLIMCLIQDDVKALYLARADRRSRRQLDGRNSEQR